MQVTLDGYSSPGDADWVDSWADGLDLLPPVDAFILGGGMFPDYERFWATILEIRGPPPTCSGETCTRAKWRTPALPRKRRIWCSRKR